ncbi:MAG: flavodoxin family protein [Promethearchaeota archaeon]
MSLLKYHIVILYYSKENNTKMLAKRIFDIFREFIPNDFTISMMDATNLDIAKLQEADGLIIGSPDYFGYVSGHIKIFFDDMYPERSTFKGRPVFGFITHGGKGSAQKALLQLFASMKFQVIEPVISVTMDKITSKIEAQIQKNCLKMLKIIQKKS